MSTPAEWYSPRYAQEWIQCARKVLIFEKEKAESHAKVMTEKYHEIFNSYQCPFCGGFHVGRIGLKKTKKYLQNRAKHIQNALNILTPAWLERWTKVL